MLSLTVNKQFYPQFGSVVFLKSELDKRQRRHWPYSALRNGSRMVPESAGTRASAGLGARVDSACL